MTGSDNPQTTVNYVTSHDGQTLHDLTGGDERAERLAQAILAVSEGIPMRQAGSEMGYTQYGNHDAYCCGRGELAPYMLPWAEAGQAGSPAAELHEFTAALHGIRNSHPVFRQPRTPTGETLRMARGADDSVLLGTDIVGQRHPLGEQPLAWLGPWGHEHTTRDWESEDQFFGMHLSGLPVDDDSFIVFVNGNTHPVRAVLGSDAHPSARGVYEVMVDTDTGIVRQEGTGEIAEEAVVVAPGSLTVLRQIAQRLPNGHPALNANAQAASQAAQLHSGQSAA